MRWGRRRKNKGVGRKERKQKSRGGPEPCNPPQVALVKGKGSSSREGGATGLEQDQETRRKTRRKKRTGSSKRPRNFASIHMRGLEGKK